MTVDEITVLQRAHDLFAGSPAVAAAGGPAVDAERSLRGGQSLSGAAFERYHQRAAQGRSDLRASGATDAQLSTILRGAADEHAAARQQTRVILDAARADSAPAADTPMGQREFLRRRVARLRAQHRTVSGARLRALRRLALIRALRYGRVDMARLAGAPNPRAAMAVRAALSKLGRPYVWGATGPNAFDCSGLVQWAYRQAGVDISRTTWTQIHDGAPVPRSMIAVGDLVFPNRGHVQMYIGNGQVVEAPYSGASIRISSLGDAVAIRRPII
ncbi:C40 family peptidase [Mycolicibacterium novocastrense]|uniref:C40 family peptidase n=1 Tax=Mycolicibacterium novocastrense TaxID=59813 RepID=A0AAW5SJ27_MYCNV|nr:MULTISPECIES: C40 family peptidase [Mycolicibacterium]MCV7023625.1 C40 family peptidase [Mycolicibacterium novocastrense]MDX1886826.1 C40 family peptidase [Mycolicibacterium sp. 120270]